MNGFGRHGGSKVLSDEALEAFLWGDWIGSEQVGRLATARPHDLGVTEKLSRRRFLSVAEFDYLNQRTDRLAKISLPSPSLWANFWSPTISRRAYPTMDLFLADVADALREEVTELVRRGARYIQLDAPHYPLMVDPSTREFYEDLGWTTERWLRSGIELDNWVMEGFREVSFGLHLCRGNQRIRWLAEGGYDQLAGEMFRRTKADRLLLECDDERSGSFEPLKLVPPDKMVVLGLISTKSGELEDRLDFARRIREAADYFPLEQLAISPQCGFASSVYGNLLSDLEQQDKLQLTSETAREIWGNAPPCAVPVA